MNISWFIKRLFSIIPVLLSIIFIVFFISIQIPGDPVYALVGERADEQTIEYYRSKLGLDQGIAKRFASYCGLVMRFDFGKSYYTQRKVSTDLMEKIPNTLLLAFASILFAVLFGVLFGALCALYKGSWLDKILMLCSTLLISSPVFWFGLLLMWFFAYHLKMLPVGGMQHPLSFVLPAMTLGSRSLGYLVRLTRSTFLDVFQSEYMLTIKAKGGGKIHYFHHGFVNVIVPLVTFIGLDFASYLNGSVLTETIFAWDGIGRYAINGIIKRDYPVIIGTVLFGSFVFMIMNLFIDVLYYFISPMARKGEHLK